MDINVIEELFKSWPNPSHDYFLKADDNNIALFIQEETQKVPIICRHCAADMERYCLQSNRIFNHILLLHGNLPMKCRLCTWFWLFRETLQNENTFLFEIISHGLFLETFNAYHLLLKLVIEVLMTFKRDFGQDRRCTGVVFRYEVTSHGPQENQSISYLILDPTKIIWEHYELVNRL